MKAVCTHCGSAHDIEFEVVNQVSKDYVTLQCLVCGTKFDVLIKKIVTPKYNEEIYLVPKIIPKSNIRVIYENFPDHVKDEI